MEPVRAKKQLGQHFLKDTAIAQRIAESLWGDGYTQVLEIGPGMGVLTQFLLNQEKTVSVVEIDRDSVAFLEVHFSKLQGRILSEDFLKYNWKGYYQGEPFAIIGNFPYNISTQIVFRCLEMRDQVPEFAGMFQKEVAERICEKSGSKAYGILSVLTQAFYDTEYLFTVSPDVFQPPPKVQSGVLRMKRKANYHLPCSETLFFRVVKQAFQQRRKTLRNSLKSMGLADELKADKVFDLRPEQLSVEAFISLTQKLEAHAI
ncbi:MAG: 16S rRNA (adenine(1518)-N(6)/adenine(1519)-N(6))-dimethyltransferase [Flavobacterium sp. BFFFF2]|nr:MAG: 16S rRNA (adenine(1518)-N(6)/adenine(1519)-N(6))-dimethyltransferase [Flavobacterium sp. BFFFF2]